MKIRNYILSISAMLILPACGGGSDTEISSAASESQSTSEKQSNARAPSANLQQLGGINARLDGERRGWFVTGEKTGGVWRSQSDVNVFGNTRAISIFGHAAADTTLSATDALTISATVREVGPDLQISGIEITFLKGGFGAGSYSTANDGEAEVEITNIVTEDGLTHIVGTFSATLPYKKYSSREAEPDNIVTIEGGRFNVKLPPLVK